MIEVKADSLEASFEQVEMAGVVQRPMLTGAAPNGAAFEGYLRSGATVEMKSFNATASDTGGYALPREIDAVIDATLKAISPIRAIANVVQVGSAGYAPSGQHYFAGFAAAPGDWTRIVAAAEASAAARTFVWALPQVMRDGLVFFETQEDDVDAFDDVLFPLALGREAEVSPGFSTAIATSAGGHEVRTASWAAARTSYDVGPGVRSEADIATLLSFYRARLGPARGFRLRDPFDSSGVDEAIGTGDGVATRFALVRHYGEAARRITRPVSGSVSVKVAGVATVAFGIAEGGWVEFDTAPATGAEIAASFTYDVPVRFAEDRLSVSLATFLAGAAPSVPLVEIREV
jgi:uncharacterized protein (TIGR02217 family)